MIEQIKQLADNITEQLLSFRHQLHAHPELSFQEYETAKFVATQLDKWHIPYQSGIAGTGMVAFIEGINPTKSCIALRADMDALPIQEENEKPYKSQNPGVMHACGHDVHTTCLLGAAYILKQIQSEFEGTVKLIFQPGEEKSPGGASLMIQEGVLENPKPEAIIGLHVFPEMPVGIVGFRAGQYMASADEIYITIKGKGGHAALPHLTVDPIAISAQVITALQQIVSRKAKALSPSVLSFGKISGGHATNVIPDEVKLAGTLRTFDEAWRHEAKQWIVKIATQIAEANGATAIVEIPPGYPSLYNHPELTYQVQDFATNYLGKDKAKEIEMRMTAEDFSFYSLQTKACFFRLGTNQNNQQFLAPVHTPTFDIDEQALTIGAGLMAHIAYSMLTKA